MYVCTYPSAIYYIKWMYGDVIYNRQILHAPYRTLTW